MEMLTSTKGCAGRPRSSCTSGRPLEPSLRSAASSPAGSLMRRGKLWLSTCEQRVHLLGAGGHDGPELVPVHRFGDLAAGVADEPGDLFHCYVAVGHQADEGMT